jgi:hypothetical protein
VDVTACGAAQAATVVAQYHFLSVFDHELVFGFGQKVRIGFIYSIYIMGTVEVTGTGNEE